MYWIHTSKNSLVILVTIIWKDLLTNKKKERQQKGKLLGSCELVIISYKHFIFVLHTILYLQLVQDKIRLGHFQNQISFQQITFPNNDLSYKMLIKSTVSESLICVIYGWRKNRVWMVKSSMYVKMEIWIRDQYGWIKSRHSTQAKRGNWAHSKARNKK